MSLSAEFLQLPDAVRQNLMARFEAQAKNLYSSTLTVNASPLYAHLCLNGASDPEILALVIDADRATQIPNLLFGAVHYLLLSGVQHPLAAFYPDLTPNPRTLADSYPIFQEFCRDHSDAIRQLVNTRRVQTNEVRRCSALLPAFGLIAQRSGGKPLALVEVGASAGLHLRWDRYCYNYGESMRLGDPESPVQIVVETRGEHKPPIPDQFPEIIYRIGLDLHPVDASDEAATRWLRALIWPEHKERRELLDAALSVARANPVQIITGDAAEALPDLFADAPDDAVLCVYHSYALNQMPQNIHTQTLAALESHASQRDFFRVSQEWYGGQDQPHLHLFSYRHGQMETELLAYCESHGRWIEWLQSTPVHK
jgi:hypothetical protein